MRFILIDFYYWPKRDNAENDNQNNSTKSKLFKAWNSSTLFFSLINYLKGFINVYQIDNKGICYPIIIHLLLSEIGIYYLFTFSRHCIVLYQQRPEPGHLHLCKCYIYVYLLFCWRCTKQWYHLYTVGK